MDLANVTKVHLLEHSVRSVDNVFKDRVSNVQPSLKRGKYGHDEHGSFLYYNGAPPRKKFWNQLEARKTPLLNYWCENGPKINHYLIVCLSIEQKKGYYAVDFHNSAPTHLSTEGFECQILKIQDCCLGNLQNRVFFSPQNKESGFSSKIGATPSESGWLDTLQGRPYYFSQNIPWFICICIVCYPLTNLLQVIRL